MRIKLNSNKNINFKMTIYDDDDDFNEQSKTSSKRTRIYSETFEEDEDDEDDESNSLMFKKRSSSFSPRRSLSVRFSFDHSNYSNDFDADESSNHRSSFLTSSPSASTSPSHSPSIWDNNKKRLLKRYEWDATSLRRSNLIHFIIAKNEKQKQVNSISTKKSKTNRAQIEKIINRINMNKMNRNDSEKRRNLNIQSKLKLRNCCIKKIRTKNWLNNLRTEGLKKVDQINIEQDRLNEIDEKKIYYQNKSKQIMNNAVNQQIEAHCQYYTDSIILIGDLARTLPKMSEPPELIWSQLMKKLTIKD
jgi:hypothetical protein